jgi:hypothetical protein
VRFPRYKLYNPFNRERLIEQLEVLFFEGLEIIKGKNPDIPRRLSSMRRTNKKGRTSGVKSIIPLWFRPLLLMSGFNII